jgi:hypothetical protein
MKGCGQLSGLLLRKITVDIFWRHDGMILFKHHKTKCQLVYRVPVFCSVF